jgi:hypothetical protein
MELPSYNGTVKMEEPVIKSDRTRMKIKRQAKKYNEGLVIF